MSRHYNARPSRGLARFKGGWNETLAFGQASRLRRLCRVIQCSPLTLHRDMALGRATCVRKSNASLGARAVTGRFAFFALFAVENLADYRGG
jgi:hypothetical protein